MFSIEDPRSIQFWMANHFEIRISFYALLLKYFLYIGMLYVLQNYTMQFISIFMVHLPL